MSKRKVWKDLFSFGFKKKPPKKYQVSKWFFKKEVYINWFIQTLFLFIRRNCRNYRVAECRAPEK